MDRIHYKLILTFAVILIGVAKVNGQTTLPEELTKNSLKEQINYIEQHTRIFEDYRAIREDMFQRVKGNIMDSLSAGKIRTAELNDLIISFKYKSDSLKTLLASTKASLDEVTTTKNHIRVFGIEINKVLYNIIMFAILAGLIFILAVGFLAFKRNLFVNISTRKELKELKDEFEAYRQSTRIAREKMAMDHFNEIKKLKGNK
ncbi:MAG: hypothetical protein ABR974_13670 [Bacteroidales bacterium]